MSCWKCECGWKNCDSDVCTNPRCTVKAKEIKRTLAEQKQQESVTKATNPEYRTNRMPDASSIGGSR